jgi:hypothetical protein
VFDTRAWASSMGRVGRNTISAEFGPNNLNKKALHRSILLGSPRVNVNVVELLLYFRRLFYVKL